MCGNTVVKNETLYTTNNQRRCTLKSLSLHRFMTVKIGYYTSSKKNKTFMSCQLCTGRPIVWGDMKVGTTNLQVQ